MESLFFQSLIIIIYLKFDKVKQKKTKKKEIMRSIFDFSEARKQMNKIFHLVSHGNLKKAF